jgi:hypothetical protein
MSDPLYGQVIAWAGLAVLFLLCLPLAGIQKLVLEVCALALRLALLALLGAAAYLWFRPGELPVQLTDTLNNYPQLSGLLPDPTAQYFGICAAAPIVILSLPLLAILDVTRKLAGWRLRRLRKLSVEPVVVQAPPAPVQVPVVRRTDGRVAAATLADAGSRRVGTRP